MIFPDFLQVVCLIPLILSLVVSQTGSYMIGNKWSLRFLNPPFVRADACLMPSIKVWDSTETLLCGENRCFSLPAPSGIPSYNPNCISIRWEWLCTTTLLQKVLPTELVMLFLSQCCCCLEKQMERPLVTPCDTSAQPLLLLWHILSSSGRPYPASVLPIVFISHGGTNKRPMCDMCWGIFHLILYFCLINTQLPIVFSGSMTLMRCNI